VYPAYEAPRPPLRGRGAGAECNRAIHSGRPAVPYNEILRPIRFLAAIAEAL
jgi:hypothetical protein